MSPSLETRQRLMRQYGSFTLAYSATYQSDLEHFGDERGFIAFQRMRKATGRKSKTAQVLADPIAPREEWPALIDRFRAAYPDTCFWQLSKPAAEILATRGFFVNEMGTEIRLDLPTYTFDGKEKRNLRMATNRMQKRGYVTRECALSELDLAEVQALSETWRQTRAIKSREMTFLNRPLLLKDEPDVRRFFTFDKQGKMVAFGFFDPVYENGNVIGYSTSFKRRLPEADMKAGQAITRVAIEQFQREGRKYLFLGLSPMADVVDGDFRHNRLASWWFRFAFGSRLFNKYIYNLQGHADHKREFHGNVEQTYYASQRRLALPALYQLMAVCRMFG